MVDRITALIVDLEKDESLYQKDWVIPGATPVSAALDFARTTCRRAERHIAAVSINESDFDVEILRYFESPFPIFAGFWRDTPRKTREIPVSGGLLWYALNCAAIQRQKIGNCPAARFNRAMLEIGAMKIQIGSCGYIVVFLFHRVVPMKPSSHGLTRPICCRRADGSLNNG